MASIGQVYLISVFVVNDENIFVCYASKWCILAPSGTFWATSRSKIRHKENWQPALFNNCLRQAVSFYVSYSSYLETTELPFSL